LEKCCEWDPTDARNKKEDKERAETQGVSDQMCTSVHSWLADSILRNKRERKNDVKR
jgi:hypothetical protein